MTDESDAAIVASRVLGAFRATPGATDWLRHHRAELLRASVYLSDHAGATLAGAAVRASLREMVRRMAPDYGASARENTRWDGTLVLEVDGGLADIRRLILAIFYEGFSGFHVEVARPEMLAALERLYPMGLSASSRDVPGLSYML